MSFEIKVVVAVVVVFSWKNYFFHRIEHRETNLFIDCIWSAEYIFMETFVESCNREKTETKSRNYSNEKKHKKKNC